MAMGKGNGLRFNSLEELPLRIQEQIKAKEQGLGSLDNSKSGKTQSKPKSTRNKAAKAETLNESSNSPPHDLLWSGVSDIPGLVREFPNSVPGRKFRLDIAHPGLKIAIEVDGWQYHGKYKEAHSKDRERQNLLTLHGWTVLRFSAGQIFKNLDECVQTILKTFVLVALKEIDRKG